MKIVDGDGIDPVRRHRPHGSTVHVNPGGWLPRRSRGHHRRPAAIRQWGWNRAEPDVIEKTCRYVREEGELEREIF